MNRVPFRSPIRWGILGCGDVTEVKSGPAFRLASGSRLVAVMRRNGSLAADYARRHGVPAWYDDAARLIADPEVDAVYIATPPDSHHRYALDVAAAGKPAYVEKPLARNTAEGDAMVKAFADRQLPLFVAYYRRALPRFVKVKAIIDSGQLGTLTGLDYHFSSPAHRKETGWRTDVAVAGGGLFLDLGSHALDLIDHLVGPLSRVAGTAANLARATPAEDSVVMHFLAGGIPGVASWNFASDTGCDRCRIQGTEGAVEFAVFENAPVTVIRAGTSHAYTLDHPAHVQQPLIQSVVDDLLGRGKCVSTGETALRTSQVMDQVLADYYGGRTDAFWERPASWPGLRR